MPVYIRHTHTVQWSNQYKTKAFLSYINLDNTMTRDISLCFKHIFYNSLSITFAQYSDQLVSVMSSVVGFTMMTPIMATVSVICLMIIIITDPVVDTAQLMARIPLEWEMMTVVNEFKLKTNKPTLIPGNIILGQDANKF